MKDFTIIAWRNVKKRRLRSFLTLIGIIIAIATIFTLISVSIGLNAAVEEQFRQLGTDKFFIQPKGALQSGGSTEAIKLTEDDLDTISRVSGVKATNYWVFEPGEFEYRNEKRFVNIVGLNLENFEIWTETATYEITQGRFIEEGDGFRVMVGSQYANGKYLTKDVQLNDNIEVNGFQFKVVGILKSVGNSQDDRLIYMPEEQFREVFNISDRIDSITAQIELGEDINQVADRVEKKLRNHRDVDEKTQDFTILTPEELLATFGDILNILTVFLLGIAAISMFVGGIGIANTMFTSVLERTKEIGVMKAIGARNSDILTIFLIEAGILGIVGGAIGVILGIGIVNFIVYIAVNIIETNLLQVATPSYLIIGSIAFSFLAGAISGIWPAWQATKIRPVEALRYE
jgi:putative ABC transport system permease protein